MLTIEDIRNPKRKSGFDHVNKATNAFRGSITKNPYHARAYPWHGPRRATAEEAARDYCDYINSLPPLTIEDIRNPKRRSGFDHVSKRFDRRGTAAARAANAKPYQAVAYGPRDKSRNGIQYTGRRRATAEEAAQDYCDYINAQRGSNPSNPGPLPRYPEPTIDMGNAKTHAPKVERIEVKREVFTGPHDLYDVLILTANGDIVCRKAGITARGHLRYADVCKTFGMSIKPVADAVTYPTKVDAEAAERARVAEICADPKWRRVGKESFAPNIQIPAAVAAGSPVKEDTN